MKGASQGPRRESPKRSKIKYFLISFVDLFGVLRAKLVPARAIGDMQKDGAGFAGFAAWLDMTPGDPDMFAIPDPDSLIQLPWKPEVGWLAADLWMDGKEVEASPRVALKRQIAEGGQAGLPHEERRGVRVLPDQRRRHAPSPTKARHPGEALLRPVGPDAPLRRHHPDLRLHAGLGWGPYQNDHEDANGQFEMNWDYDDCLKTADRHVFFKFMTKSIAEKHGLRATFMPKPFPHLTGNGCHAHVSLWDKTGRKNLFHDDKGELGLSKLAYNFLGGIMHSAESLAAFYNPTVNSYKRINAPRTTSGATWAPNTVTYGGNNRTHMVRIPDSGRFELRLMDGAANPYLMQAATLAAGLDGIENKRDPGKRYDINMYEEGHKVRGAKKLPLNLLDSIRSIEKNKILRERMSGELIDSYAKLKYLEWNSFKASLSQWERDHTLDC